MGKYEVIVAAKFAELAHSLRPAMLRCMPDVRYLTKSRFKLALDCPAKLYYTKNPEYYDCNAENDFLMALADGGHQVGALAQAYYPGGELVESLGYDEALGRTAELLQRDKVVIYEAAFAYRNLFIRADILVKDGSNVRLIEVKAKSCVPGDASEFQRTNRAGKPCLGSDWESYLCDVAFQHYVVTKARADLVVTPVLMCADKSKVATVDGLNAKFQVTRGPDGRSKVKVVGDVSPSGLGEPVLHEFDVSKVVAEIQSGRLFPSPAEIEAVKSRASAGKDTHVSSFERTVHVFADHYERDVQLEPKLGTKCKSCEFHAGAQELARGFKCGFRQCWGKVAGFKDADFDRPLTLEVWNWRGRAKKIEARRYFQEQLSESDFPDSHVLDDGGYSSQGRQWLQCRVSVGGIREAQLRREWLKRAMKAWRFPAHFIDFETSTAALPYHRGHRPYGVVAFQFSHHVADESGQIRHAGQWLLAEPGKYPNFEFVRALRRELGSDSGTIFRYSHHENTVLNQIRVELKRSGEPDRDELISFIESIAHPPKTARGAPQEYNAGPRDMVDLCDVVKRAFYQGDMRGSNSIKAVLPAILNCSEYLKRKYSEPVYGSSIPSLNLPPTKLAQIGSDGLVVSPYLVLTPVLGALDQKLVSDEFIFRDDEIIKEGGAASVAYGRVQFTQMSDEERNAVRKALLAYCELDTMAMALLWEFFRSEISV